MVCEPFYFYLVLVSVSHISSDLLGVPDKDVWAYGEALRSLAAEKGFEHIDFSRLKDLVSIPMPESLDEITYVSNATNFRRALLNKYSNPDWEWKTVSQRERSRCIPAKEVDLDC